MTDNPAVARTWLASGSFSGISITFGCRPFQNEDATTGQITIKLPTPLEMLERKTRTELHRVIRAAHVMRAAIHVRASFAEGDICAGELAAHHMSVLACHTVKSNGSVEWKMPASHEAGIGKAMTRLRAISRQTAAPTPDGNDVVYVFEGRHDGKPDKHPPCKTGGSHRPDLGGERCRTDAPLD